MKQNASAEDKNLGLGQRVPRFATAWYYRCFARKLLLLLSRGALFCFEARSPPRALYRSLRGLGEPPEFDEVNPHSPEPFLSPSLFLPGSYFHHPHVNQGTLQGTLDKYLISCGEYPLLINDVRASIPIILTHLHGNFSRKLRVL